MSDEIDAAVQSVKPPRLQSVVDRVIANAESPQLPPSDHPVLFPRERRLDLKSFAG